MVLTKTEKTLIQDLIAHSQSYNNLVALAAVEDHNCTIHEMKESCDLRDSLAETARYALEDFNKAMERLKPFTGPKLE